MNVFYDINEYKSKLNSVVGIGCFDALHKGHIELVKEVVTYAKANNCLGVIFSIENYKQEKDITTNEEKLAIFDSLGIDAVIFQSFSDSFKATSAEDFLKEALVGRMQACAVAMGSNFRFGRNGTGDANLVTAAGLQVIKIPTVIDNDTNLPISSTLIHQLLADDKLEEANKLMGRNFNATGIVDYGKRLASKMGYPTANIYPPENKLALSFGVYASYTYIDGEKYKSISNVGINPTTDKDGAIKFETHIFDLNKDIYKQKINVEFLHKLRNEQKFKDVDSLFGQIKQDIESANDFFKKLW